MESFAEIVSRLLLRHNCVIIPDFGGFVARISPSEIDEIRGVIYPPKKSILFNQQLILSDGLLTSEYALTNELTFTESQDKIKQIVSIWKEELNKGEAISIEKVGTLQVSENGSLQFVQDRFFNLLLSSFGLGNVKFVPVVADVTETELQNERIPVELEKKKSLIEKADDEVDVSIIEHPAARKRTTTWKIALAAACILPIAFYSYWIPVQTNVLESGVFSTQDFNPFSKIKDSKYTQNPIEKVEKLNEDKGLEEQLNQLDPSAETFSYELDESTFLTIPLHKTANSAVLTSNSSENQSDILSGNTNQTSEVIIEPTKANSDISFSGVKSGKKYAIVGCFSEVNNAKKYVYELNSKGLKATFLDFNKGLYRISLEESSSIDSLQPTIQKASSLGYNTWILK
jgi:nucleoid DNA-binding protein